MVIILYPTHMTIFNISREVFDKNNKIIMYSLNDSLKKPNKLLKSQYLFLSAIRPAAHFLLNYLSPGFQIVAPI